MAGGYTKVALDDMSRRGVRFILVEMRWAEAEPRPRVFDEGYLRSVRELVDQARRRGYRVMLNFGLDHAPPWVLGARDRAGHPIGRFVDQNGTAFTQSDLPNLVFANRLRVYAREYVDKIFAKSELGQRFFAVRVGGGLLGELDYPNVKSNGRVANAYWAFDAAAQAASPVPGYRPCTGDPKQAARFLNWYFDRLVAFQNWQVRTVRRSYRGLLAVIYPSWGVRPGDFGRAVADNLCGRSSAERNGEIQLGVDHARQIAGLPRDRRLVVWGSWVDNPRSAAWLFHLADKHHLRKMGENSGGDTDRAAMVQSVANARRYGLTAFMWVRAPQAFCHCGGFASIEDYQSLIGAH
jgi:hypothetical protein